MADNIEHQDKGELVANCDQLQNDEVVVTTPVESRIMSIRGKQIMIDRDLAELYGVETKRLNEAVKRNIERFPERFRFQLTKEEMAELVANCDRFNSLKHSYVQRTWFAWRHRVMGLYYAGEHSADVYWHRALINQKDVGIALQLPDPTNEKISWFLILQKK